MNRRAGATWLRLSFLFACLLFVVLTTRFLPYHEAAGEFHLHDTSVYLAIAETSPSLPAGPHTFHHAQRFASHYLIGSASKLTGLPLERTYAVAVLLCAALIVCMLHGLLETLLLDNRVYCIIGSAMLFNPYFLRYYLVVPQMIQDLVFVCGCFILLYGLVKARPALVFLALGLAALSRQTTLLLLPTTLVWLGCSEAWSRKSARGRLLLGAASVLLTVVIYAWSASVASSFSLPSRTTEVLLGLASSMGRGLFSLPDLAEFTLRLLVPFCVPLSIVFSLCVKPSSLSRWVHICLPLSAAAAIVAQPLLAGPAITGANATRLAALGLPFAFFAIGRAVEGDSAGERQPTGSTACWGLTLIFAGIFLSTWHHMLTIVGPAGKTQTFIEQVVASALVFAGGRLGRPWGRP